MPTYEFIITALGLGKRILQFKFELPSYIKPPAELLPIMTALGLVVIFEAYYRTYETVHFYPWSGWESSGGGGGGAG